jgi:hypothetical protein
MLRVNADHPVKGLAFELEGAVSLTLDGMEPGQTSFLQLPVLPAGNYTLRVQEHGERAEESRSAITIEIREPRPNRVDHAGPLVVWTEPFSTRLDQLWEGAIAICAAGAAGQRCRGEFTLADKPAGETLAQGSVDGIPLPLLAGDWRSLFRNHLQAGPKMEAVYDQAAWARVVFDAGRFGRYALEFDRQLPPVRWRLRSERDVYSLELRDDTESRQVPKLRYATFEAPDRWLSIVDTVGDGTFPADPAGGVYAARVAGRGATILVPPAARTFHSLRDLSLRPRLSPRARQAESLSVLAETTQVWATARLPGNVLARTWRTQVVRDLQADLFSLICGPEWRKAEFALRQHPSKAAYDRLQRMVVASPADAGTVAGALVAQPARLSGLPLEERIGHFKMLARRGKDSAPSSWHRLSSHHDAIGAEWLAEFCLRAASDVHLVTWAGECLRDALDLLITWPLPARAARCLVLWDLVTTDTIADFPPLFPDWEWSLV